jgi:hypothetical protein
MPKNSAKIPNFIRSDSSKHAKEAKKNQGMEKNHK